MVFHFAFAKEFVAGIQEVFVVAIADELVEFGFGEALFVEVVGIELNFFFEQETSCFAAGGSGGFLVESDFWRHVVLGGLEMGLR
jgi:hypothetical protein